MKKVKFYRGLNLFFISLFSFLFIITGCSIKNDTNDNQEGYLGTLKSKSSGDITGSYWGIQASTLEDSLLDKAAEIGVKWTRLGASWPGIEKEKDKYDWSRLESDQKMMLFHPYL